MQEQSQKLSIEEIKAIARQPLPIFNIVKPSYFSSGTTVKKDKSILKEKED